ncbi:MAG: ATP-binding protein [Bacteroidales bacterium]
MNKTITNQLYFSPPSSKDFFKHIQRFLEVGFWYWDRQTNHIHFSKKVLSILGIKSDELGILWEDFFNAVHPEDQKVIRKAFDRLLLGKSISSDLEFRILRKGYWRWARTKVVVAEYLESGEVSVIIGKFFDIDENKYSIQPVEQEKKKIPFSFFSYCLKKGVFQFHNPKQNIFDFKISDEGLDLFEQLKPFVTSTALNQFKEGWQFFLLGSDSNYSYSLDYQNRKINVVFSKSPECVDIIEGLAVNASMGDSDDAQNPKIKYSQFLNLHQLIFLSFNSNNVITFCNRFAEKILGYKFFELKEDFALKRIFIPNSDTYKRFTEHLKSASQKPFECNIISKDGIQKVISWTIIKGFDITDELIVLGRDVSQLRSIEQSNDKLSKRIYSYQSMSTRLLLQSSCENIYFLIGEQLEKLYPKHISTVFSFDSKDSFITLEGIFGISQRLRDAFISDLGWNPIGRRFQLLIEAIERLKTHTPYRSTKTLYEIADGYISLSAAKIVERNFEVEDLYVVGLFSGETLYGGILVFSSLPDSKFDIQPLSDLALLASIAMSKLHSELALNKQLADIRLLNARKLDLLTHVSHEIRTPLNAILGFSQLLVSSELEDFTKKQYIDIINGKGKALLRLINDIIDFNKIEKGELTIVRSNFNLNKSLNEIYQLYLNELILYSKDAVELKLVIPGGADIVELFTDEGRLVQVFENLIDNALKFTERGTIEFGYTLEKDNINFYVHDTGIGIDPKMQEMIFEKYRQLDTFQTQGSTGLGLKITKEIVMLLSGTITVDSELGIGTTFNVVFPLNQLSFKHSADDEQSLMTDRKVDFKNKVILIVDDEEANCLILEELLSNWGAQTLLARNGKEAVDLVNSINQTIDLVLMDIRMPIMDGYAATMEIKQINSKIPIIAQTAYASDEDQLKAESAGCNGYITKPIDTVILSDMLEHFLLG